MWENGQGKETESGDKAVHGEQCQGKRGNFGEDWIDVEGRRGGDSPREWKGEKRQMFGLIES